MPASGWLAVSSPRNSARARIDFAGSPRPTLGVEWEFALIDPVTRDRFLGDAAGIGVDLVGAWIDGNGIAPVILGVERVLG